MKFNSIFSIAALVAVSGLAQGQTVTVNKAGGSGVFTTISEALASFNQPEDNTLFDSDPNIIHVTDNGVYEEVITINTPVTLEATGSEKATIELLHNPNGFAEYSSGNRHGQGGIFISLPSSMTTGTVKIKNFNILPSLNTTLDTRLRSVIENGNNNVYVELDGVVIAPNKDHTPLEDDPTTTTIPIIYPGAYIANTDPPEYNYPATYDPSVVQFGAHGIILGRTYYPTAYEGDGVELMFKDSVIHTLRNDYYIAATEPERAPTGIVMHASGDPSSHVRITHIEGESGISFARVGISICGDLRMQSSGKRIQMRGHANEAIRLDGAAQNETVINDTAITDNSNTAIRDAGYGNIRFSMKNSMIYMTLHRIINVLNPAGADAAAGTVVIEDSTLVGGRETVSTQHTIRFEVDTLTNMDIKSSILAGKRNHATAATNVISLAGFNTVTMDGSAIVTQLPNAFRTSTPFSRGTNAAHPDAGTYMTEDPAFDGIQAGWDPSAPNFLNVRNSAYVNKGVGGTPLGGAANYVGGFPSNVSDWNLY